MEAGWQVSFGFFLDIFYPKQYFFNHNTDFPFFADINRGNVDGLY